MRVNELTKATAEDLVASSSLLIDTEEGTKGLPADLLAKKSDVDDILQQIEVKSANLWKITTVNGFLYNDGIMRDNKDYDSCLMKIKAGRTYEIHNQNTERSNNMRIYKKDGDTYTQIYAETIWKEPVLYTCPDDDDIYLQFIRYKKLNGQPAIYEIGVPSNEINLEAIKNASKKTIKILSIGNSYSRDNLCYVPALLENICGIDVVFGILYKGGATLEQHYSILNSDGEYPQYDKWTTNDGRWNTVDNYNSITALNEEDWDVIILQQQSNKSGDYATYQPYLKDIVDILCNKVNHSFKLGWLLTMAYPDGYSVLNGDTSDEMFNKIVVAVQTMMEENPVSFVIPCGTATQNARHTSLDSLGDFGHLSYEGLHLQEGVPCLIGAYVAVLKIMELIGLGNKGILANGIIPNQSWINNLNIPEQNGDSVGATKSNCILAQKCAIAAIKKPYEITNDIV